MVNVLRAPPRREFVTFRTTDPAIPRLLRLRITRSQVQFQSPLSRSTDLSIRASLLLSEERITLGFAIDRFRKSPKCFRPNAPRSAPRSSDPKSWITMRVVTVHGSSQQGFAMDSAIEFGLGGKKQRRTPLHAGCGFIPQPVARCRPVQIVR